MCCTYDMHEVLPQRPHLATIRIISSNKSSNVRYSINWIWSLLWHSFSKLSSMPAKDICMIGKISFHSNTPFLPLQKPVFCTSFLKSWNENTRVLCLHHTWEFWNFSLLTTRASILGRQHILVVPHTTLWYLVYTVPQSQLHKYSSGILQCMHLSSFPLWNN